MEQAPNGFREVEYYGDVAGLSGSSLDIYKDEPRVPREPALPPYLSLVCVCTPQGVSQEIVFTDP